MSRTVLHSVGHTGLRGVEVGFVWDTTASWNWVGPDLPADPDNNVYQVLFASGLSRLLVLDPTDELEADVHRPATSLAAELVEAWWIAASGGDLDGATYLDRIEATITPAMQVRDPALSVLDLGRLALRSNASSREAWEASCQELLNLLDEEVLRNWGRSRFPGSDAKGHWVRGTYHPSPRSIEFAQVRSALPTLRHLNVDLDVEADVAVAWSSSLAALRQAAERSGRDLQLLSRRAAGLIFPGPNASTEAALSTIAELN